MILKLKRQKMDEAEQAVMKIVQNKDDLKEQKESDDDCDQEEERGSH
jgi:hypothetical protein